MLTMKNETIEEIRQILIAEIRPATPHMTSIIGFETASIKIASYIQSLPSKEVVEPTDEEIKLRAEEFWQLFRLIRNTVSDENGYVLETAFKKTVETFFIRPDYMDNFWVDYNNKITDLVCNEILNYQGKGKFGGEKLQKIAEIVLNSTPSPSVSIGDVEKKALELYPIEFESCRSQAGKYDINESYRNNFIEAVNELLTTTPSKISIGDIENEKPYLKVFLDWFTTQSDVNLSSCFEDVLEAFQNSIEYKSFAKSILASDAGEKGEGK